MTHLVPINLPLRLQMLRIPVKWKWTIATYSHGTTECWFFPKIDNRQPVTAYDAWEMRNRFLRLRRDDYEGICEFLNAVGLFSDLFAESPIGIENLSAAKIEHSELFEPFRHRQGRSWTHHFQADGGDYAAETPMPLKAITIHELRIFANGWMAAEHGETGYRLDFNIRFPSDSSSGLITTTNFSDALALSIRTDQLLGAKMQKCKRPDCGILFSSIGPRKRKYCTWYCGHIESVRRQRRKEEEAHGK